MWSVREGLERFIQSLELTPRQRDEVSRQHTLVRERLRQRLKTKTDFLSGSYSRNTSIRPLHDIDLFIVLGEISGSASSLSSPGGLKEDESLRRVRQALHEEWPDKELPGLQRRSVHIGFSTSGIEFDVVPAFELSGENAYYIHERHSGRWLRTNPRIHEQRSTEANERAGKALKPLLKVVKHWNRNHPSSPLRSFHLEAMSYSAFASPPRDYLEGLEHLFLHLGRSVMSPCPDPAGLGPPVEGNMDSNQREDARRILESAAEQVRLIRQESDSQPRQAHARLGRLLGDSYRQGP